MDIINTYREIPHYEDAILAKKAVQIILEQVRTAMSKNPYTFLDSECWDLPHYNCDDQKFIDDLPDETLQLAHLWVNAMLNRKGWTFIPESRKIIQFSK